MDDTDIWSTFTDDQLVFLASQPGPIKRMAAAEADRRDAASEADNS